MDCLLSLNSVRALDASKKFTLKLRQMGELCALAAAAGKKAVTLDVVTILEIQSSDSIRTFGSTYRYLTLWDYSTFLALWDITI